MEDGINDLRMGTTDKKLRCKTCNCDYQECPGHFGYIKLAKPVFHVGFIEEIKRILRCVCFNCRRILIDNMKVYQEIKATKDPKKRRLKIYNYVKSRQNLKCLGRRFEKRKEDDEDNIENQDDLKEDEYIGCGYIQPSYKRDSNNPLKLLIKKKIQEENSQIEGLASTLTPEQVLEIFTDIKKQDSDALYMLGFNEEFSRPEWMIIKNLAVCPPQVRPSVSVDSSLRSQDDLTGQYVNILKKNRELLSIKNASDTNSESIFDTLQFYVATLMNNDFSFKRQMKKSGQPLKDIYDRLKGKEGRVRGNLMGKRVDYSARSVISPDPNLDVDELGVPVSIAKNLTFPETVTESNKSFLQQLINSTGYPGAKTIINNKGKIDLRMCRDKTDLHLEVGDIVERHMLNGDYVIFNRQPSLYKMSMMGHRVHILPYSTFRLNLSVTTPYNADFDGDEMNLHLPQSYETKSEIMNIMHVPKQIVSPQSNRPVMGIVQDSLIGAKLFKERDNFLTSEQVMNLLFWIKDFDIGSKIPIPAILKPQPLWTGKQIFSLIIPKEVNLTRNREDTPAGMENKLNIIDNKVEIIKGELIQGIICKRTIGSSSGGIIHFIWMDVSPQKTIEFLSNCQKLVNNWLLLSGWTVGISDIICDSETNKEIGKTIIDMKKKIRETLYNARIGKLDKQRGKNMIDSFEDSANKALNNATSITGKLVSNALNPRNHLKNMVSAGSKGSLLNISQIIGSVGQQNVEGKRIPFNYYHRTLPHFTQDDYGSESRGFVENSFLKGLTPQEFFFHAMGGREGIIDTAVKTSQTGYIQRKLIKSLEDIMVKYDNTLRNSLEEIIGFLYGEDGMAGEYIEDQFFRTLNMNDETLEKNYKFIDIDSNEIDIANKFLSELSNYMTDEIIEKLKGVDFSELRFKLNAEYEQIKKDRDEARKIFKPGENDIHIPVNLERIIKTAIKRHNINEYSKSDLNPIVLLKEVEELKKQLILIKGEDEVSKEGQKNALKLFSMFLNYNLSTKFLIKKCKINETAFKFIIDEIKSKFSEAMVRPGEMVGSIAAQSIGEPATQMTLNTFHLAGVSSVNVTLGVPRLIEILNLAKKLKTPIMTLKPTNINKEINEQDRMLKLKSKIEYTMFYNIVDKTEIYYDPDIQNSIIEEDRELFQDFLEMKYMDIAIKSKDISPWVLRISIKINILLEIERIREKISEFAGNKVFIMNTSGRQPNHVIQIRLDSSGFTGEQKENMMSLEAIRVLEKNLLTDLVISGIPNIKKMYSHKETEKYYDNKGNFKRIEDKKLVIQTDGSNLNKIFEIDEIDYRSATTNNINEVYQVLGIEASRQHLLREVRSVLNPYGIYVNYRHVSLLCDYMTRQGYLCSITRHGLNRTDYGPIRKATFEETVEILLQAGLYSEKDNLRGISENILLGNMTRIGTGFFDLLLDFKQFNSEELPKENKGFMNDDEKYINSPGPNDFREGNQTPYMTVKTPNYLGMNYNNLTASAYGNSQARFTPGYGTNSINSPYNQGSVYRGGDSSYISTPNPILNSNEPPNSPIYNPGSDYFKTPAPDSPNPLEEKNMTSEYNNYIGSAYSPITRSPGLQTGSVYTSNNYRRNMGPNTATPRCTYSPTTPFMAGNSSSPKYFQGSDIYSVTPKLQESANSSQYEPNNQNYDPLSPNYNIQMQSFYQRSPMHNDNQINEEENEDDNENENNNNNPQIKKEKKDDF